MIMAIIVKNTEWALVDISPPDRQHTVEVNHGVHSLSENGSLIENQKKRDKADMTETYSISENKNLDRKELNFIQYKYKDDLFAGGSYLESTFILKKKNFIIITTIYFRQDVIL